MAMTLTGFAAVLGGFVVNMDAHQRALLDQAAILVQDEAKEIIGTYQAAAGPFPAWASLADSTKTERVAAGYTADDPLLRRGDLRDSIERAVVSSSHAEVGSNSKIAVYQELGTATIPPRSFLGTAAVHKEPEIVHLLGNGVATFLQSGGTKVADIR